MLHDSLRSTPAIATFADRGARLARRFCEALEFGGREAQMLSLVEDAFETWGDRRVGQRPVYPSNIGDDHSPFEFSVAFGAGPPEVRLLWESQGDKPDARSNLVAARVLTDRLAQRWRLGLDRLRAVEDLYLPTDPAGGFALWHAACFWRDRDPAFKVYLNPNARGPEVAGAVVRETLARLGFRDAWSAILASSGRRGRDLDSLAYVSLDLDNGPKARLKIYYRHHHATADDIEAVLANQRDHRAGDARAFCVAMAGNDGPYRDKPVQTCASLLGEHPDGPTRFTAYFPVASYAPSDATVCERVRAWMRTSGLPVEQYDAVVTKVAHRALTEGSGFQSYVSLRREAAGVRSTVYFSPELYRGRESGTHVIGGG